MGTSVLVTHPSPDLYGSDRIALETVTALIDTGYQVVVTVPTDGPLVALLRERGAQVELVPTPVLRKAYQSPGGLLRLAAAAVRSTPAGLRLIRRVRPDLVYVSTVTTPLWLLLGRLTRRTTVCHVHEAEQSIRPLLRRALLAPLLLAHHLVLNSHFTEQVITSTWPRLRGRSDVVHNGVAGPPHRTVARDDVTHPRLVFVGRLSERKGVDVAVRALARLRARGVDATLDVVGATFAGNESFDASLAQLVTRLGLDEHARFHGLVGDVWGFLAAADVALVPSRLEESFGNAAIEAVLAGRPVIASATSGLREAVRGLATVRTVPPGDVDALADAVGELVSDWHSVRERLDATAQEAQARYAPAQYRRRITAVLARALDADSGKRSPEPPSSR